MDMTVTLGNVITILVYAVTVGVMWGSVSTRLKSLEKKQDAHNQLIERTYKLETIQAVQENRIAQNEHNIEALQRHAN